MSLAVESRGTKAGKLDLCELFLQNSVLPRHPQQGCPASRPGQGSDQAWIGQTKTETLGTPSQQARDHQQSHTYASPEETESLKDD